MASPRFAWIYFGFLAFALAAQRFPALSNERGAPI
jgi:hypothetical protein